MLGRRLLNRLKRATDEVRMLVAAEFQSLERECRALAEVHRLERALARATIGEVEWKEFVLCSDVHWRVSDAHLHVAWASRPCRSLCDQLPVQLSDAVQLLH